MQGDARSIDIAENVFSQNINLTRFCKPHHIIIEKAVHKLWTFMKKKKKNEKKVPFFQRQKSFGHNKHFYIFLNFTLNKTYLVCVNYSV